jgi:hypothetical protein
MADVRRASDTRPLPSEPAAAGAPPPTPGRQRITSMMEAASSAPFPPLVRATYVPPPGGAPPLTKEQASKLIDASKFPLELKKYKQYYITAVVNESLKLPSSERRPFETLLRLTQHPCSYDSFLLENPKGGEQSLYVTMKRRFPEYENMLKTGELTKEAYDGLTNVIAFGYAAKILVLGHDVAHKEHYIFDKDGNIIDLTPTQKARRTVCARQVAKEVEERRTSTWRPSAVELGYGSTVRDEESRGKKGPTSRGEAAEPESDPFKGSPQGSGKTRKNKRRGKKTLRRRKVRRNVH